MATIFKAAETGNIRELIKLKSTGADFHARDEEGNTVLIFAAAFGRLEIVKWLLNDGGATIDESNSLHSTPLLMAAYQGQLATLDYLIRHYYIDLNFNKEEEKLFSSVFKLNKPIRFYLSLFQLLSEEKTNYSAIKALLKKAANHIKHNEVSFLYLLCFWVQIHKKITPLSQPKFSAFEQLCMKKLPVHLQGELIEHMFKQNYVLTHWDVQEDSLLVMGAALDQAKQTIINQLLQEAQKDPFLKSQTPGIDSDSIYAEYYLKPIYSTLTYALLKNDDLTKALHAPYTYHLNTIPKELVKELTARWTAYHLCRDPMTSIEQHQKAYNNTIDKSRLAYYETIESQFTGTQLQKKSLLQCLGNIPDSKGERLYWVKGYPVWLQYLDKALSTEQSSKQTLALIGLLSLINLSDELSNKLWDKLKHRPQPQKFLGNHPVYHLPEYGIYCKLYPGLPGVTDALQHLYRRIFSVSSGMPWSVSGLLKVDNQTIPVLLSEDAGTFIEDNDQRLNKLDSYSLGKLIIFTMLTNTEDGKPDNYTLKQNEKGLYDIYLVDSDHGLVESINEKTNKMAVKSVLFCLDAMNEPLNGEVIDEFLQIQPIDALRFWIKDLIQLADQYDVLFGEYAEICSKQKDLNRCSYLQMVLPMANVLRISYKLQRLQELLRADSSSSPLVLLSDLEPNLAKVYEPMLLKEELTPTKRFDTLNRNGNWYSWCSKTKKYRTTRTSAQALFESFAPTDAKFVTPKIALNILDKAHEAWEEMNQRIQGEIASLIDLPLKDRQSLLKMTPLNQFNNRKCSMILDAISKKTDFTEIYLRSPSDYFKDKILLNIVKKNALLECLTISDANKLIDLTSLNEAKLIKKLKLVSLPIVENFTTSMGSLTHLTLKNCQLLKTLHLVDAPELTHLNLINCNNLSKLSLPKSLKLKNVIIEGCEKLPLASFYTTWPRFISLFHEVPSEFRYQVADSVKEFFATSKHVNAELVYDIVATYLKKLKKATQVLGKEFTTTDANNWFPVLMLGTQLLFNISHFLEFGEMFISGFTREREYIKNTIAIRKILNSMTGLNLEHLSDNQKLTVPPLILSALKFPNSIMRRVALEIVIELQLNDEIIMNTVSEMLEDVWVVRKLAANALIQLYPKPSEILPPLFEKLVSTQLEGDMLTTTSQVIAKELIATGDGMPFPGESPALTKINLESSSKIIQFSGEEQQEGNSQAVLSSVWRGLIYQEVPGDGHCLYHALAYHLGATYINLRNMVADYLETNPGKIQGAFAAEIELDGLTHDEYILGIRGNLWGGQPEIQTVQWITGRPIIVIREDANPNISDDVLEYPGDPIFIFYNGSTHYNTFLFENDANPREILQNIQLDIQKGQKVIYQPHQQVSLQKGSKPIKKSSIFTASTDQLIGKEEMIVPSDDYPKKTSLFIKKPPQFIKTKKNKEDYAALLFAATKNDLVTFKSLLGQQSSVSVVNKNYLNKLLTNKHWSFFVIDHLIRHCYVSSTFDESEQQALDAFTIDKVFKHYFEIFKQFSQEYVDYKKIKILLKVAAEELNTQELSFVYLIYLWMQIRHLSNTPSIYIDSQGEPKMCDLLFAHQTELISHMIREGYTLNHWSTNESELIISDMTFDEKQGQALDKLLEQSEYDLCLMLEDSIIEENTIYVKLLDGLLQYKVIDPNGKLKEGNINLDGFKLTTPLTLDQLHKSPAILDRIKEGDIHPEITSLSFNHVHFTKKYRYLVHDPLMLKNGFYVEMQPAFIKYTVLSPSNKRITGKITLTELKKMGLENDFCSINVKKIFPEILKFTEKRGHTASEKNTKGYEAFLNLMENQSRVSKLTSLTLNGCDLWGDGDLDILCPILAKRAALCNLNLDNNHITNEGLEYLLKQLTLTQLSVRFNKIKILSLNEFNRLKSKSKSNDRIQKLYLEGNMIVANDTDDLVKAEHKKRVAVLCALLPLLSQKIPQLTFEEFLATEFVSLNSNKKLKLKVRGQGLEVILLSSAFECYKELEGHVGVGAQSVNLKIPPEERVYSQILSYLKQGIDNISLPQEIKALPLPKITHELSQPEAALVSKTNKKICKQFLNYHARAPLKGKLITNSLFSSPTLKVAPSFLYPDTQLTLQQGRVYLIAHNRGLEGEHMKLAYEYLTGYGQRVFRIAQLYLNEDKNKPYISFDKDFIEKKLFNFHQGDLIATFISDTKTIKAMHASIEADVALETNLPKRYQKVIFGSSRNDKVQNCTTYCIDKLMNYLKIDDPMDGLDFLPSSIVKKIIKSQQTIENQLEKSGTSP